MPAKSQDFVPGRLQIVLTRPLAFLFAALLFGCVTEQEPEPAPLQAYVCDGVRFAVREEGDAVRLYLPQLVTVLPRVPAASGARYSDGAIAFWSKGEDAMLQTRAVTFSQCRLNAAEVEWEEARIRGVDFRAAGHDPVWFAEIADGGDMSLAAEDTGEKLVVESPRATRDRATGRIAYRAGKGAESDAAVFVESKGCTDRATGATFPMTVTMRLGGRDYRGCGRPLR
jgi:putative lipoprotein